MDTASRSSSDPALWPAHVLAREIAARRLSPVDVVEALLVRIERLDPKLHAFVDVYAADARLAAAAADTTASVTTYASIVAWGAGKRSTSPSGHSQKSVFQARSAGSWPIRTNCRAACASGSRSPSRSSTHRIS
jgi:hypothetical protein